MFDITQMIDKYLGGQPKMDAAKKQAGDLGGIAGGALAGGLMGLLAGTKTGRKIGKGALTYGGTAVLGGLAYKAWRDWQDGKSASAGSPGPSASTVTDFPQPPEGSPFLPQPGTEREFDRDLVRAMIGTAKVDGRIDDAERGNIQRQVDVIGLNAEMRAFVEAEISAPLDIERIVASATCPEKGAEIYAASLLAADVSRPAERGYLAMLAARLNLEPGLVAHINAKLGADAPGH